MENSSLFEDLCPEISGKKTRHQQPGIQPDTAQNENISPLVDSKKKIPSPWGPDENQFLCARRILKRCADWVGMGWRHIIQRSLKRTDILLMAEIRLTTKDQGWWWYLIPFICRVLAPSQEKHLKINDWKMKCSFWDGLFSENMLVLGGVGDGISWK